MLTSLLLPLTLSAAPALAQAQDEPNSGEDLEFNLEGFYRMRWNHFKNLYDTEPDSGRYTTHKLRLQPELDYGKGRAKFIMMTDVMDNVVWGDNADLASTSLFAGDPSLTGLDGQPSDTFQIKRAWMEFALPVGLLRAGRMESHWGMGLLANDGNGFDDTFGENNGGNQFDRVIFATKPIAIAQTIAGRDVSPIPLFTAFGVDRLVEDPLTQYYGYDCDPDDPDDSEFCAQEDDHGYTEEREDTQRDDQWWLQHGDDVIEFIYVVIYRGEDLRWGNSAADLTAGMYAINRKQLESSSNVWIYDAYFKTKFKGIFAEGEALTIQGETEAIALAGAINYEEGASPLYKEANIFGGVARLGYERPAYTMMMEAGMASGDDNVSDADFTGRPLHPDHNVGLLLYDEIISRVTQERWGDAGRGLWSNGGVYNSKYIFPHVRLRPLNNMEIIGAYLVAWPHKPDGAIILDDDNAEAKTLGWEADLAIKQRWQEHILFSMEGGLASVTDRLPVEELGLTVDGKAWTVQSRLAYEF